MSPLALLRTEPLTFVLLTVSLVGAIALHEFAHAFAADVQGDRLPRAMGRVTLNPKAHLDPIGTLALVLVGFGWGKPVEFRPQALSSQRFGAAIVALAGPVMNLGLAVLGAFALALAESLDLPSTLLDFFNVFVGINIVLAVFNLIPLPPLDGSRLLTIFLPPRRQNVIFWLDRYGFLILLALLFFGGLTFLGPIVATVNEFVRGLAGV